MARRSKSKGRTGQNEVRDMILKAFPDLEPGDVKCAIMGETGLDIHLSPAALKRLNWNTEVKRRKSMKGIYDWYQQAKGHGSGEPVVCIRQDRDKWLAIVSLDYLLELESK